MNLVNRRRLWGARIIQSQAFLAGKIIVESGSREKIGIPEVFYFLTCGISLRVIRNTYVGTNIGNKFFTVVLVFQARAVG